MAPVKMIDRLSLCLSGEDERNLVVSALKHSLFPDGPVDYVRVDGEELNDVEGWRDRADSADYDIVVYKGKNQISYAKGTFLKLIVVEWELSELHDLLAEVPFELASFFNGFGWDDLEYSPSSFGDMHYSHGWACAFRGKGHDRLVSRRWLKYAGPWLLIRNGERDVSFVQFHSLDADAETALEQAKPGHERMGISDTGGFIQTSYVYETDFDGIYLPEERVLEIVVHGREIPQVEMLDACALRHYQALGDDQPLANVRYVFMTEENARKHLRELWLRELECWVMVDGQKVRLDEDYDPGEPPVPEWAEG